jgi:hypothetical protein
MRQRRHLKPGLPNQFKFNHYPGMKALQEKLVYGDVASFGGFFQLFGEHGIDSSDGYGFNADRLRACLITNGSVISLFLILKISGS